MMCPNDGTPLFASAVEEEVTAPQDAQASEPASEEGPEWETDGAPESMEIPSAEPASGVADEPPQEMTEDIPEQPASVLDLIDGSISEGGQVASAADQPVDLSDQDPPQAAAQITKASSGKAPKGKGAIVAIFIALTVVLAILGVIGYFVLLPLLNP